MTMPVIIASLPLILEDVLMLCVVRRIYIHGGGAKTIFIATHLSRLPNPPPITIIVHELPLIAKFTSTGKRYVIFSVLFVLGY